MPSQRSRSRRGGKEKKKKKRSRSRSEEGSRSPDREPYRLELIPARGMDAWEMFDIEVEEGEGAIPHVAARPGEEYLIRVRNNTRRHIACAVTVDGENALLKDGSLIVAPGDRRELPGFLVSKNFRGKEYVKEYKNFLFSKPKVVEKGDAADPGETAYTTYGRITCEVFEAVCDEEADSDDEMHGQSTHYRGAGLHGSFDDRVVPEGKKTHLLYSAVTAQGDRQHIANSVRGRWWVRGPRKMTTLEVRYREAHSLMLLGVPASDLGIVPVKDEGMAKSESEDEKKKEEKKEDFEKPVPFPTKIECCDLTEDGNETWTEQEPPPQAPPVSIGS
eukprot:TRINITY_DN9683_c0_g1_i1.p1 TRINITY_DN9683_c0_g1~~TRINITY_DN9683_c0_g1_i1.p1  ORF type:complete len:332 (-),score=60.00 TRINITY_DN9683_c0_g1_i1:277-1272(-)